MALMAEHDVGERSLADRAYLHIRDLIFRGVLRFGAEISRREVAAELGISVLPVAEALQRLEQEALVESVPRVGTRVRIPTPTDVRGFTAVREALESQAARLFAEKAAPKQRKEILEMACRLDWMYDECAQADEAAPERLHAVRVYHMDFHMRVAEYADCPFLYQAIEKNQILTLHGIYDQMFGRRRLPGQFHEKLARALISGDSEIADRAMRQHVRHRLDEILQGLEPLLSVDESRLAQLGRAR